MKAVQRPFAMFVELKSNELIQAFVCLKVKYKIIVAVSDIILHKGLSKVREERH